MILLLINERHKCNYSTQVLNTKSQHSVSSNLNLLALVSIKSWICPLTRGVLVSTILAACGVKVRNKFCSPASKSPLDLGVLNVCCRLSASRSRLPPLQRSWGQKPDLMWSSCILEAEHLLFTSPLSELITLYFCEFDTLPINYDKKTNSNRI